MTALVALVLLGACANSTSTATHGIAPSPTVPADPCAFIAAADVGPVVGGPVDDGHVSTANGAWNYAPTCVFQAHGTFVVAIPGSNADFRFASVGFLDEPTYEKLIAPPTPFGGSHRVAGYGDEAFEVTGPHEEVLFVRDGRYRVAFDVAAGAASFLEPEERLARIVLPRLPA